MIKKIAGVWLCIFLASSIVYATSPFEGASISGEETSSDKNLETSDISTKVVENTESSEADKKEEKNTEEKNPNEFKTSSYTVVAGDYLSAIASRLLGDAKRWPEIVELNKDKYPSLVSNPNLIYVGWTLTIPGEKGSNSSNNSNNVASNNSGNSSSNNGSSNNSNSGSSNGSNNSSSSSGNSSGNASVSNNTGKEIITADSRVLHIGDSHSMGIYGKTIDGLMRETGAKVKTEAFGGANPQWFMNGQRAVCGSYSKDENGKEVTTGNNQINTPLLSNMLSSYKPSVLVVSLGANMVAYPESTQRTMVRNLLDQAKSAGCKIVWVGPPDSRTLSDSSCDKLYNVLKQELPKYDGVLVDSRQYTKYPSGGDGIHYWGTEGVAQAKNWANEAMNDIQGK